MSEKARRLDRFGVYFLKSAFPEGSRKQGTELLLELITLKRKSSVASSEEDRIRIENEQLNISADLFALIHGGYLNAAEHASSVSEILQKKFRDTGSLKDRARGIHYGRIALICRTQLNEQEA